MYVDLEIEGLSFVHLEVKLNSASKEDSNLVDAKVVYRFEPVARVPMTTSCEIHVGGQQLRLRQIDLPSEPLGLEIRHSADQAFQAFSFSVEAVTDMRGTPEDAGAYNMNVNQTTADTDTIMLLTEV